MSSFEEKPEALSFLSKDMCRICLKSGSASSVRASVIAEKYRDVTSFEVQPTDIPQKVCLQCNNLILELFEFVQTCKRTEETLRALQGGLKVEKKDIPESPGFSGIEAQAHPIEACFVLDIKEEAPETDTSSFWGGVESFSPEPSSLEIPSAQPEPSFDCSECGKSYLSRKSLQRHLARVHKITIPLPEKTPDLTDAEKKKRDAHDQELIPCDICGSIKQRRYMKSHQKIHTQEKVKCTVEGCHKIFAGKDSMRAHINYTHGQKLTKCQECDMEFSTAGNMRKHFRNIHQKWEYVVCEVCGKSVRIDKIARHRQNAHSNQPYREERIPCELCGKLIAKHNMGVHRQAVHTQGERLLCDMCPKRSFKMKYELTKHMKVVHLGLGSNMYKVRGAENIVKHIYPCSYCGMTFSLSASRKVHEMSLHQGEKPQLPCEFEGCPKMFFVEQQRKTHVRKVHASGGPLTCSECGKSFKVKEYLQKHRYSHSRSYVCPYRACQTTYSHAYLLHDHMRKVHPEFVMPPKGSKLYNVDLSVFLPPGAE